MDGSRFLTLGAALLLGTGVPQVARAQVSGSVQVGQSRSITSYNNGSVDTRNQGGSVSVSFGPGGGVVVGGAPVPLGAAGGPYGRMGYGRGGFAGAGGFGGGFGLGSPNDYLWSGLIDRNFEIMRRTSPFPDRFAGGIYNPRFHGRFFGPLGYGRFFYPSFGYFDYGGYAFGYGPGAYGAYVPSVYSLYGSWYPPYLPIAQVYIIERDTARARPDTDAPSPEPEAKGEPDRSAGTDEGDYYLAPRTGETLNDAVADIRHAWMNGDFARLKARLPEKGRVRIYLKGKYKYSVDAPDFGQMTQDAIKRIDTVSFTLDNVKRLGDDRAFASGKHVYDDPEHVKHEVYVSYGLVKENGRWRIAEAGSSTEPISSHGD